MRPRVDIMSFCDSDKFAIDEFGIVRHKRTGSSYAERVIDGVALDITLQWESDCYVYYLDPDEKEESVGVRTVDPNIQEKTKQWPKGRGERKFYRSRRVPKRKIKNFHTKPKTHNKNRQDKVAAEISIPSHFDLQCDCVQG